MKIKAVILVIGDEVLSGKILETNSNYIVKKLQTLGIKTESIIVAPDDENKIIKFLEIAFGTGDIVITTGGLGPTIDDKTLTAVSKFLNKSLKFNEEIWQSVKGYYEKSGNLAPDSAKSQALIIEGADYELNPVGTAPAQIINVNGKFLITLPGVPQEMQALLEPSLKKVLRYLPYSTLPTPHTKTFLIYGIQEAALIEKIKKHEEKFISSGGEIAYYPAPGIVKVSLKADNPLSIKQFGITLEETFGPYFLGEYTMPLEEELKMIMTQKKWTLAAAESCTGGYLSHLVTSVPGASEYFLGGIVSYSNEIKEKILEVPAEVIQEYGAVSEETVLYMAMGLQKIFSSNCLIAISGIAGPTGGTPQKPVGTIWILAQSPNKRLTKKFNFTTNRIYNIQAAANCAIALLLYTIKK